MNPLFLSKQKQGNTGTSKDDSKKTTEKKKKRKELSAFFRMVASLKQDINDTLNSEKPEGNNVVSTFSMECDAIPQESGYSFDASNLYTEVKKEEDTFHESYADQSIEFSEPEKKKRSRSAKAKVKKSGKNSDANVESAISDPSNSGQISEKKSRPPVSNLFCDDCDMVSLECSTLCHLTIHRVKLCRFILLHHV